MVVYEFDYDDFNGLVMYSWWTTICILALAWCLEFSPFLFTSLSFVGWGRQADIWGNIWYVDEQFTF
jgi:hypothetical protein